jgi:hypothetical protein
MVRPAFRPSELSYRKVLAIHGMPTNTRQAVQGFVKKLSRFAHKLEPILNVKAATNKKEKQEKNKTSESDFSRSSTTVRFSEKARITVNTASTRNSNVGCAL